MRRLHLYKSPTRVSLLRPLGPCGPGPCGPPWALLGGTLVGPLGPRGPPLVLVGQALVGPPGPLWPGPLWPPWALMGRAVMGPLGLMGRALMGTLVNHDQRLGSMANPLNLLATLKLHKAMYGCLGEGNGCPGPKPKDIRHHEKFHII